MKGSTCSAVKVVSVLCIFFSSIVHFKEIYFLKNFKLDSTSSDVADMVSLPDGDDEEEAHGTSTAVGADNALGGEQADIVSVSIVGGDENNSNSSNEAAPLQVVDDAGNDEGEKSRLRRMDNVYKKLYKYHPPAISKSTTESESANNGVDVDKVTIDDSCGSSPDFDSFFSQSFRLRSGNAEDQIIFETFFKDDINIDNNSTTSNSHSHQHHYIELGAFDGARESNTRFYEKCLGWEGLLIEGNPGKGIYDRLVNNRPNSHRMNYVPSCNQTEEDMNKTIGFHARAFTNSGLEVVDTAYNGLSTVDVPCGTMTQVLLDVFPPHGKVSFFSLDVEGSEHLVLSKALDLEKVMIEMLMVEVENNFCLARNDCAVRNKVREHMKKMGYVRFSGKIRYSDVFIRQDSKLLQKAIDQGWEESIN